MTTDERLNDTHTWQSVADPNTVPLSPANMRRLHRLHARAELAQEVVQQANNQFQEALLGIFEDAGLQIGPQDGFNVDWRNSTLTLKPGGAQP